MNTTQRLALYETAQEAFGVLIADRAALIYSERQKASPDQGRIAHWQQEQDLFAAQENSLRLDDHEGIEQALKIYGPQVKALFEQQAAA